METEDRKNITKDDLFDVPANDELFAGEVFEELSPDQLFAGDEDFYASMDSAQASKASRFSPVQKALAACIALVAAGLLYMFFGFPLLLVDDSQQRPIAQKPVEKPDVVDNTAPPKAAQENQQLEPVAESEQPNPFFATKQPQQHREPVFATEKPEVATGQAVSLRIANNFYLNDEYEKAYSVYKQLGQTLSTNAEEELMRDFLELRMALCLKKPVNSELAGRLLKTASKSRSPIIRVIANYHRSLLGLRKKQYMEARTRAYQAIALINAVDLDKDIAKTLQKNCHFLAAEAITKRVFSLRDDDGSLPPDLWVNFKAQKDPFIDLSETELRFLLESGIDRLNKALLGPKIQQLSDTGSIARWSVICYNASIDELLARFAANASLDIHWTFDSARNVIRERAVNLYLPAAMNQQTVTIAAGSAGLLARLDEKGVVDIFNPSDYSYVSEYISLLSMEAISLWQTFLLTSHDDHRLANAHFILGLLQAKKDQPSESLAEYKLVANRFSKTSIAPYALLNSSKLKNKLRDYSGGRDDLSQLVVQYPDSEIISDAYLYLADTTAKAGLKTEAARIYRKIYNLNLSVDSQAVAALAAGRCFYEIQDYKSAAKWLAKYISTVRDRKNKDLYTAYFLMGKTHMALGQLDKACDAFQCARTGQLSREEYVETTSALVEGYMIQGDFVQALDVLDGIYSSLFSRKESIEILLLKSKTLREIGLVDETIALLSNKAEYITDLQLKAKISLELSDCYIEKGELAHAYKKLTEIVMSAESGPLACEAAFKLAKVCSELGKDSQALSVCSQLLDLQPSEQIKQKTLILLAKTYEQQKNYNKAALALLGQW